ncbi:MAG: S9 family peptidase [Chloroflexota bacterium]|nr:S9 family peptidase [Chloroflexota bacterium]
MAKGKVPITAEDLNRIHYVQDPQISPDGRFVAFVKVSPDPLERGYKRNIWLFPLDGGEAFQLTRGDKDSRATWSPDGKQLAFVSARGDKAQVYLLPTNGVGGEACALTDMKNGAHSPAWSPDGTRIAFLAPESEDERRSAPAEDSDALPPIDKLEKRHRRERQDEDEQMRWDPREMWRIPYRRGTAFVDERYDQIYVIDIEEFSESEAYRLTDIDADHTQPRWSADGASIYTSRTTDPEGDEPWRTENLYRIDAISGQATPMTDGAHSAYAPLPSPDGKWLAFGRLPIGVTDIPMRLLVMTVDGADIRIVNEAFDREAVEWAWSQENQLAFTVESEGRTLPWIYDPASDASRQLHDGFYDIEQFDIGAGGLMSMTVSTPQNPQELYILQDGDFVETTRFNQDWLSEVIVQDARELRFQSPHGEVQGWYLLPVGYQPGQTYPLALNIHGGPHATWGYASKTMWHEWQFHAARGYAVFYCNPHGSGGYGEDFMRKLHAAWGPVAMDDIMAGVDAFLELGIADAKKMAITGGSYGGYMTAWIISHSDRFKAAVAQRGVYNLSSFYGTTDVPLLMSNEFDAEPWENHEAFWDNSPLKYAANIRTPLLLIHSENDFRVPIEQGEQLFAWVRRATDTPIKMLRYPREGHELSRSGEPKHRISRLTEMIDWFDKYVKD